MLRQTIRMGRVVVGVALLAVGGVLSLPLVPGPGLVLVFVGLTMLAGEFHWARRLRDWIYERFQQVTGRIGNG